MKTEKVIVEPGYYEVTIRPVREGDVASYFDGVGGVFKRRRNVFKNLDACLDYLHSKRFDDGIYVDASLEDELQARYPSECLDEYKDGHGNIWVCV